MLGHIHLKWQYKFEETFDVYLQVKNQLQPYVFPEMFQRYCKLITLGTLGMPGYTHPKWYYQLVENLCVYLQAKIQFHPPHFLGDIAKINILILGILGMPGYAHPKW